MRAVASISQSALTHNLAVVKKNAPDCKIVAMVKANAYGHHLDLVQPLIKGADVLAVSELAEVKKIRKITDKPILLLSGVFSKEELQQAIELDCQMVIHHQSQIAIVANTHANINVWLKVDTGMHRLGLYEDELTQALSIFEQQPLINVRCIMSHFACADEKNHPMNTTQLNSFKQLNNGNISRSMANSAAILSIKEAYFDDVRPGIMLYGVSPFGKADQQLKAAMQLSAPILSIKTIKAGEPVGYGATWIAEKTTEVAVVGIGYGDGYPRHAKNGTPVLINHNLCSLIGRVSMDLICVDVTDIGANVGDKAILWGDEQLPVETVAHHSDTTGYELLADVTNRVQFTTTL